MLSRNLYFMSLSCANSPSCEQGALSHAWCNYYAIYCRLENPRQAAWSPEPPRTKPLPRLNIEEHRERFLQSKHARRVPDAPDYHVPRQPEGVENIKIKHWSKLTAGVRWNPIKKQFKDTSVAPSSDA